MKILVSALEHSANNHLKSLKKYLSDDVVFMGIFDKEMGNPIVDLRSLSIMGFVDALRKIRYFLKLNAQMVALADKADKILLIDSSGFNLPLAKKIKKRYPQKEIIYYILPQAWAWKQKRIPVLEKNIDHLASILPFEKEYYSEHAPISYVGHPLLDTIETFKTVLEPEVKKVVFMPGSRKGEIKKLMPVFHKVREALGHIEAILVVPQYFTQEDINEIYGNLSGFKIASDTHQMLYEADFAFICSGTATLEAALIGTPFVLSYIAKPLDYFIASRLIKLSHVGLSNIMFEKFSGYPLHPEFIQDDVTVENLLEAYKRYDRKQFLENSKQLRKYLEHGSSKTLASLLEEPHHEH